MVLAPRTGRDGIHTIDNLERAGDTITIHRGKGRVGERRYDTTTRDMMYTGETRVERWRGRELEARAQRVHMGGMECNG